GAPSFGRCEGRRVSGCARRSRASVAGCHSTSCDPRATSRRSGSVVSEIEHAGSPKCHVCTSPSAGLKRCTVNPLTSVQYSDCSPGCHSGPSPYLFFASTTPVYSSLAMPEILRETNDAGGNDTGTLELNALARKDVTSHPTRRPPGAENGRTPRPPAR